MADAADAPAPCTEFHGPATAEVAESTLEARAAAGAGAALTGAALTGDAAGADVARSATVLSARFRRVDAAGPAGTDGFAAARGAFEPRVTGAAV